MMNKIIQGLQVALQPRGSVIAAIYLQVLLCGKFGTFVSILYHFEFPVSQPILGTVIPSVVLGLLLVLRTNTAYERFWEGRKCWGSIVNNVRNLARLIWISVDEISPEDRIHKISTLRLLLAFAVTTKLHLRGENLYNELEELIPPARCDQLKNINNPPLEVAFWIGDYLQQQYKQNCLNTYQLIAMQKLLNNLVDNLGACERIIKTPMPVAYGIMLKQLLIIYCFLLPFQIVESFNWWTGLAVALVSFILFGIEAIGLEIENPFGRNSHHLPLDTICDTIKRNISDLISLTPSTASYKK